MTGYIGAMRHHIETIINNRVLPTEERFEFEGWNLPKAGPREIALAIKSARMRPANDLRRVVSVLADIGRRGEWINDNDLLHISKQAGSAYSYLRRSIARLNDWFAGIESYVSDHGLPIETGYRTQRGIWRGGITTAMVLAGDATAVGPLAIAHGMLAGARLIAKGSRYEPLAPLLFVKELIRCGLQAPDLVFIDSGSDDSDEHLARLLASTRQSVVYGSDATLEKIYDLAKPPISHKRIGLWSGRSGVVVLDDADPDQAANIILIGTAEDRGNRCYSTMKAFVPEKMLDAILTRLVAQADRLRRGDPDDPATDIGRLENDGRRLAEQLVGRSKVLYDREVMFVLANDTDALLRQEMAYPVCAIRPYREDEDPFKISNRSMEGGMGDGALAMAVVTTSRTRFTAAAESLDATKIIHNRPTVDIDHNDTHQGLYLFKEMMRFTSAH